MHRLSVTACAETRKIKKRKTKLFEGQRTCELIEEQTTTVSAVMFRSITFVVLPPCIHHLMWLIRQEDIRFRSQTLRDLLDDVAHISRPTARPTAENRLDE